MVCTARHVCVCGGGSGCVQVQAAPLEATASMCVSPLVTASRVLFCEPLAVGVWVPQKVLLARLRTPNPSSKAAASLHVPQPCTRSTGPTCSPTLAGARPCDYGAL